MDVVPSGDAPTDLDLVDALVAASRAELAAGNAAGAYATAERVTELAPDRASGFACLGEAALALDRVQPALSALLLAVARDPTNAEIHALLGRVHLARGRVSPARASFQEALRLQPDLEWVRVTQAHLTAAFGSAGRREAYAYLEAGIASGDVAPEALADTVDEAVRHRTQWLVEGVGWVTLGYVGLVVTIGDRGFGGSNVVYPALASAVVLALYVWWALPLLMSMSPLARQLLPGIQRRRPFEALSLWCNSLPVLAMITVPAWWAMGLTTAVVLAVSIAFLLPIVAETLIAGISLSRGVSGIGEALAAAVTRPQIVPFVLVLGLVIAVVRSVARLVRWTRRHHRTHPTSASL